MGEFQPRHAALLIEPRAVEDAQIVPLARDHHVIVAVIAHLGRAV
jgi:hypothetical protein